jgi:uncharacterized protein with HEPN domain
VTGMDRVPILLEDLRRLAASADKIVRHGQQAFESSDGDLLRLAAKAVLIDLSTFADRLPETFRAHNPAVPWRNIRALRNFLAHDYEGTDYAIVWGVIAEDLPAIARRLLDVEE